MLDLSRTFDDVGPIPSSGTLHLHRVLLVGCHLCSSAPGLVGFQHSKFADWDRISRVNPNNAEMSPGSGFDLCTYNFHSGYQSSELLSWSMIPDQISEFGIRLNRFWESLGSHYGSHSLTQNLRLLSGLVL